MLLNQNPYHSIRLGPNFHMETTKFDIFHIILFFIEFPINPRFAKVLNKTPAIDVEHWRWESCPWSLNLRWGSPREFCPSRQSRSWMPAAWRLEGLPGITWAPDEKRNIISFAWTAWTEIKWGPRSNRLKIWFSLGLQIKGKQGLFDLNILGPRAEGEFGRLGAVFD